MESVSPEKNVKGHVKRAVVCGGVIVLYLLQADRVRRGFSLYRSRPLSQEMGNVLMDNPPLRPLSMAFLSLLASNDSLLAHSVWVQPRLLHLS